MEKEINGVKTTGLSECFASGADGAFSAIGPNFPETGLPLKFTLYRDTGCPANPDLEISQFNFHSGLNATYTEHDFVFGEQSSIAKLFLPSFDTKKGFTSLFANRPVISCDGDPCTSVPTNITVGEDRMIASGEEFILKENPTAAQTCDNIASISVTGISATPSITTEIVKSGCEKRDGKLTLRLNFTSLSGTASLGITFNDGSSISALNLEESTYRDAHNFAWDTIGFPIDDALASTDSLKFSFKAFFDKTPKEGGLLTEVREMMGPEGAGGILGAGLNCLTDTAVKYARLPDEGGLKNYKVELLNAGALPNIGSYLDDGTRLAAGSFQKQILISEQQANGSYTTKMTIHFDCAYSIGRMYSEHNKPGKIEKRLVEWNTQTANDLRVKEMKYEQESDATRIIRAHSSFQFVESPNDPNKRYSRSYSLNIQWDSTATMYNFYPRSSQVAISDLHSGFTYVNTSPTFSSNATFTNGAGAISNLTGSFAGATGSCVDKASFAVGSCSILPTNFNSTPFYEPGFSSSSLLPQNITALFP